MLKSGERPRVEGRKMAIHDARHRQGFLAPLERNFLNEAAHVTSGYGVCEPVSNLGLNVLSEDPIELPRAPLFALDLLSKVRLVELRDCPDAF